MQSVMYRIQPRSDWPPAGDYFRGELDREGFIHLSEAGTVCRVADAFFAGRHDLLLLEVDSRLLASDRLRYEDLYGEGLSFPHLYGPLPLTAVRRVLAFPCGPDGRFQLPADVDARGTAGSGA